ncbi:hypothetical protein F2Q69_00025138 [Brassica cretica]|uniref:Ubiquitin-like protease family profile domain-containing protein n=1 Tax=Brassica cretica TaxID=69181 RepID=A0A8S9QH14_BRACR|nr:hypothetical protein F2Q69_00025138 [Brassica cretica]
MEIELPKRIAEGGVEHHVDKINNTCRLTVLGLVKQELEDEYNDVLRDPVFGPILAMNEHQLKYSGRKPFRISMQEFYAVTGLKCEADKDTDFEAWRNDKWFWGTLLKQNGDVDMKTIRLKHFKECKDSSRVDRVRLVYLCVICFVMAKDEKIDIPHAYIRLVMDFDKMRKYPLGLHAYDLLPDSIKNEGKVSRIDVPASERPQPLAMPIPRLKRKDKKLDDVEMPGFHGNLHNVNVSQSSKIDLDMGGRLAGEYTLGGQQPWRIDPNRKLQIGPSMFTKEMSARKVGPTEWLKNYVNFLLMEDHDLCGMWTSVVFFDYSGLKHHKDVEPFANLIPQIVKAVQSAENKKHLNVRTYKVVYVPVPFINKISSDCRVYALKFIECHALGLDFTLVNDDNIREARQKITYDLWEAANDPELMLRMSKYTPTKTITSNVAELV